MLSGADKSEFLKFKGVFQHYSDTSLACCKLLSGEIIQRLIEEGYVSNEEVESHRIIATASTNRDRQRLFGNESFRAPPIRIVRETEEQDAEVSGVNPISQGFWKKLSSNDVSLTSSPGQIVIPIKFTGFFPPFTEWTTMSHNAMQADIYFNIIFISSNGEKTRIDKVRAINYVPAPTHPRPNQELRFTFRDREILEQLQESDILEFKKTDNPDVWFVIRLIKRGSQEYNLFSSIKRFEVI